MGTNAGLVGGSYAAVLVTGETSAGGLVGVNDGSFAGVYATGAVSGTRGVGGLAGTNRGALSASYATGRVSGGTDVGGLVGVAESAGTVVNSYWDTDTSGHSARTPTAASGEGRPATALQAPTDYAGLYAAWAVDVDVDGDGVAANPWHFGTDTQYPALSLDGDGDGQATWQERGRQLRAGPVLTAAPAVAPVQMALTWTAVDSTQPGTAYTYQVAAVAGGGEMVRSARVTAEVPCVFAVTLLHRDVLWTPGRGAIRVMTGPACAWTAASESDFLTVAAGALGAGSGTVTYRAAENAGGPRTGVLRVAGQRVTVFQASPTVFTDHPIQRGVTPVRAIHFLELRARIDALRAGGGLPAFGWTEPTLIPGVTPIRVAHLTELRAALAEAYAAAGRSTAAYTDQTATAGVTGIRAIHLMELRAAVTAVQ